MPSSGHGLIAAREAAPKMVRMREASRRSVDLAATVVERR